MPVFCDNCGHQNRDAAKFCFGCGIVIQQSSFSGNLPAGTILEKRYKIIKLIKSGGMGAVYKAVYEKFDSICAVKELLSRSKSSDEWFKREAKLLYNLHHTNLPKVSDYFIENGRYYLVMTYIKGEDLDTILQKEGTPGLPEDKVVTWAKQILEVLDYLHNQKPPIIYRDLKPANIMIDKTGKVMLIDFGIARVIQEDSESKKSIVGTPAYMPFEQLQGKPVPASDIYSLGVTMYRLLTDELAEEPFKFKPVREINPSVSVNTEKIIMKALSFQINDRFSSAKEMLANFTNKPNQVAVSVSETFSMKKTDFLSVEIPSIVSSPKIVRTSAGSELIFISGGIFQMGSNKRYDNQKPVHSVTVDSFYMGKYPVTNKEYKLFKPGHIGHGSKPDCPVVNVSWYDAVSYCNWLSEAEELEKCYEILKKSKSGFVSWILGEEGTDYSSIKFDISKNGYRLPTEAEWEYACRAGTITNYYWGDEMDGNYCWYTDNSNDGVEPVGGKKPNLFGLYDMSGNVWEWCWDWYDEKYYSKSSSKNPTGSSSGLNRIRRGGNWSGNAGNCQSTYRSYNFPGIAGDDLGFRPVKRAP